MYFNRLIRILFWTLLLLPTWMYAEPTILVTPEKALWDTPVKISVSGLNASQKAKIIASMKYHQADWESWAEFQADVSGKIDVSDDAPLTGTYSGVDPMGLFWSMNSVGDQKPNHSMNEFLEPIVMTFELKIEDKVLSTTSHTRLKIAENAKSIDVNDVGFVAKLYAPNDNQKHPGILVLGGSDGGILTTATTAAQFASHGYAALAVAYFGMEGLPSNLVDIPLEYFKKAIDWMANNKSIDTSRLVIVGTSKGAELALLLASQFSELKAVVAYVPSHVVWKGINGQSSSWSLEGEPVPHVPYGSSRNFRTITELYLAGLQDEEAVKKAIIPVEKIQGPILLISGKDDQLWPSALMSEKIMGRLRQSDFKYSFEHLSYEKAGHSIGKTYRPTTDTTRTPHFELGGTPEANAKAQADSWPKVLRFIQNAVTE